MVLQLSLNEIQVECRKATRGAGMSWGSAEETGQAVAWLAERGINAVPALLDCLERNAGQALPDDPVRLGMAIADQARHLAAGGALSFARIHQPVLILPFLAMAARLTGKTMILSHADGAWSATPAGIASAVLAEAVQRTSIEAVTCTSADNSSSAADQLLQQVYRLAMEETLWQRLQALAHHTYVPATEQSRLLGAGAGVADND
jgi:hypothetical protein